MNTRPAGLATGTPALLLVAMAAAAVGMLTGAAPVIAVTVFLLTVLAIAAVDGALALRGVVIEGLEVPPLVDLGVPTPCRVQARTGRSAPLWVTFTDEQGVELGSEPELTFTRRGTVRAVRWEVRRTDRWGLTWWRRRGRLEITPVDVTPALRTPPAPVRTEPDQARAETTEAPVARRLEGGPEGDIDDLRAFHTGDAASSIAWAASLRSRRLLTHRRAAAPAGRTLVAVDDGHRLADDAFDEHLGQVRSALHGAARDGSTPGVITGDGAVVEFVDERAADHWLARVEPLPAPPTRPVWWRRAVRLMVADPTPHPSLPARVLAAVTVGLSLFALLDAIGATPATVVLVAVSLGVAVTLCSGQGVGRVAKPVRLLVGTTFAAIVFMATADLSAITSPADVLRSALPQLLVALMVVQNFEAVDRRGNRVALSMSAMVMAYAAGLRVDGALGATVALWALLWGVSMYALARGRLAPGALVTAAIGVIAAVGVLQFVAVPAGPARLTMPTVVDGGDPVGAQGLLGSLRGTGSGDGQGRRAPNGVVGGYPGFSPTMDTSSRGPMGDAIVLRVRSPYPDFWRGQSFTDFDGQVWSNEQFPVDLRDGSSLELYEGYGQPSLDSGVRTQQVIQTFYLETDVPNLVFAAPVPDLLVIDARAGQRPDGTILTDVTLPAGTVYTVVSHRAPVTSESLRSIGDVSAMFTGSPIEGFPELQLPASTTARTIDLARQLAAGSPSTYDTIRRIEQWMATNVEYDLDAPVPAPGEDAVDHFLFESRLGFCEQIATSMAIMLRAIGVPARVATGYVPSDRDDFTGMWISRASDAHAWVEVFFPGLGWQAFDPTAEVPLAGESAPTSIGRGLVTSVVNGVLAIGGVLLTVLVAGALVTAIVLGVIQLRRRSRRGRWGRLQDRFAALADGRGAAPGADNVALAEAWRSHQAFASAQDLANTLDASAFDPAWADDDDAYRRAQRALEQLTAG